jgi:hypothetical protein
MSPASVPLTARAGRVLLFTWVALSIAACGGSTTPGDDDDSASTAGNTAGTTGSETTDPAANTTDGELTTGDTGTATGSGDSADAGDDAGDDSGDDSGDIGDPSDTDGSDSSDTADPLDTDGASDTGSTVGGSDCGANCTAACSDVAGCVATCAPGDFDCLGRCAAGSFAGGCTAAWEEVLGCADRERCGVGSALDSLCTVRACGNALKRAFCCFDVPPITACDASETCERVGARNVAVCRATSAASVYAVTGGEGERHGPCTAPTTSNPTGGCPEGLVCLIAPGEPAGSGGVCHPLCPYTEPAKPAAAPRCDTAAGEGCYRFNARDSFCLTADVPSQSVAAGDRLGVCALGVEASGCNDDTLYCAATPPGASVATCAAPCAINDSVPWGAATPGCVRGELCNSIGGNPVCTPDTFALDPAQWNLANVTAGNGQRGGRCSLDAGTIFCDPGLECVGAPGATTGLCANPCPKNMLGRPGVPAPIACTGLSSCIDSFVPLCLPDAIADPCDTSSYPGQPNQRNGVCDPARASSCDDVSTICVRYNSCPTTGICLSICAAPDPLGP